MASPEHSASRLTPNSGNTSESDNEVADVAATTLRVFTESVAEMEVEISRARELARANAEIRRAELDTEFTQWAGQTQLQIAEIVGRASSDRKRKYPGAQNDNVSPTQSLRERVVLLSLLQSNMIL